MMRLLAALAMLSAGLFPVFAAGFESAYTTHDWERCEAVPSPDGDVVQLFRCKGLAGIPVTYTGEEDGSSVAFGRVPLEEDYGFASFFAAGTTIEWRGPAGGRPEAAIIRYRIGNSVEKLDRTLLVVYRLQADGAGCILGTVPGGKGDNATARELADRHAAGFQCGSSTRIRR